MSGKGIVVAIVCLAFLAFATLVSAGPPAPPSGSAADKIYSVLNPRGIQPTVKYVGLSPRLTSLAGKTIVVDQGEADPVIMPALYDRLKATYPEVNWIYTAVSSFGPEAVEADYYDSVHKKPLVDAIIRGNAW
jgi:hypothetical protein